MKFDFDGTMPEQPELNIRAQMGWEYFFGNRSDWACVHTDNGMWILTDESCNLDHALIKQPQKVETISSAPTKQKKLKAAAYARVSTDLDSQETSIENQREHYLHYIEGHEDWELAGIYEESGVSGTKADTRPEL